MKKERKNRFKHPSVYTFRTSGKFLDALGKVADATGMFKCDLMENAIDEYCLRHYPTIWTRLKEGDNQHEA